MKRILAVFTILTLPVMANAGIANTAHNFADNTSATDRICVFCHVPHNGDATAPGLWNRSNPTATMNWGAASPSLGGTDLSAVTLGAASARCFSCHDGTQSVGSVINGGYASGFTASTTFNASGELIFSDFLFNAANMAGNHPVSVAVPTTAADYKAPTSATLYSGNVECASCHEPHEATLNPFLRVTVAASALCLDCHVK